MGKFPQIWQHCMTTLIRSRKERILFLLRLISEKSSVSQPVFRELLPSVPPNFFVPYFSYCFWKNVLIEVFYKNFRYKFAAKFYLVFSVTRAKKKVENYWLKGLIFFSYKRKKVGKKLLTWYKSWSQFSMINVHWFRFVWWTLSIFLISNWIFKSL